MQYWMPSIDFHLVLLLDCRVAVAVCAAIVRLLEYWWHVLTAWFDANGNQAQTVDFSSFERWFTNRCQCKAIRDVSVHFRGGRCGHGQRLLSNRWWVAAWRLTHLFLLIICNQNFRNGNDSNAFSLIYQLIAHVPLSGEWHLAIICRTGVLLVIVHATNVENRTCTPRRQQQQHQHNRNRLRPNRHRTIETDA